MENKENAFPKEHHQRILKEFNPIKQKHFRDELLIRMKEIKNDDSSQYEKDAKLAALKHLIELSDKRPNHSVKQVIDEWEKQDFRYSHEEFKALIDREINRMQNSKFRLNPELVEKKIAALKSLKSDVPHERSVSDSIEKWRKEEEHWKVISKRDGLYRSGTEMLLVNTLAAEEHTNGEIISQQRGMVRNPMGTKTQAFLQEQKEKNSYEGFQYDKDIFEGNFPGSEPEPKFRTFNL